MDINKFKSVAVRKADYDTLQGLCNQKFRSPASMISKLVNQYVEYQALKNKIIPNICNQVIYSPIHPLLIYYISLYAKVYDIHHPF